MGERNTGKCSRFEWGYTEIARERKRMWGGGTRLGEKIELRKGRRKSGRKKKAE